MLISRINGKESKYDPWGIPAVTSIETKYKQTTWIKQVDRKPRQQWVANIHRRQLCYKNVVAKSVKCLLRVSVYTIYLAIRLKISWDKIINNREFGVRSGILYCVGMKPYCSLHINIVLCTIKFSNNLSIVSTLYILVNNFSRL